MVMLKTFLMIPLLLLPSIIHPAGANQTKVVYVCGGAIQENRKEYYGKHKSMIVIINTCHNA